MIHFETSWPRLTIQELDCYFLHSLLHVFASMIQFLIAFLGTGLNSCRLIVSVKLRNGRRFVRWTLDQVDYQGLLCHASGDFVDSYSASPLKCIKMCTGGFNAWSVCVCWGGGGGEGGVGK